MSMEKTILSDFFQNAEVSDKHNNLSVEFCSVKLKCLLKVDLIFSVLIYDLFLQRVIIASVNINTLRQRICFRTDAAVAVIVS